ncbi:MAG: hypothetical protein HUJ76_11800, partial [Parasporobacterium sp.]|nr:hypothetical protein [Parasporobacterium sp.]
MSENKSRVSKEARNIANQKNNSYKEISMKSFAVLSGIIMTSAFYSCWMNYYSPNIPYEKDFKVDAVVLVIFFVLYMLFARNYNTFKVSINRRS